MNFTHITDYEITTAGDVPLTLKLFVSAFRSQSGEWLIEQVRVHEITAWFDKEQGHEIELFRPHFSHTFPSFYTNLFASRYISSGEQWKKLKSILDIQESVDRSNCVVHEIH